MKRRYLLMGLLGLAIVLGIAMIQYGRLSREDVTRLANRTPLSGGEAATVFEIKQTAFAQPLKNLDGKRRRIFTAGDHLFNTQWVQAPASVKTLDGLGPLFNRNSCSSCHLRDGRGRPPLAGEDQMLSKLVRISIPGKDLHGGPLPHPVYGTQLQEQSILGVPAEGRTQITWTEATHQFQDGDSYALRQPSYEMTELGYGPLGPDIQLSARVAPAVFGLGLLENIPADQILSHADPEDTNGDGISGRPNYVWDVEQGARRLGRLGWKANQPNLKQQNAGAFNGDMGLTTSLFPDSNCTAAQRGCQRETQYGDQPEVQDPFLEKLTTYISLLGVPARRHLNHPRVQRGEKLFYAAQCDRCHLPTQTTGNGSPHPELNQQVIHAYTDLLLHDMGEGLADRRPDFEASGREWRTPPLWGIGLVESVNKHSFFLHDGRARNLMEAVLWHGGEAQSSQSFVTALPRSDRQALEQFLKSL
ncbi:di-heme oxidoreductase family protein [Lyngbya confervoides]|uniref:C-type cytochrome n=1 Tax=Lyngbya confervoides BDU141951 TaxID=1574623 RepID=A0ABD4SZC8_9CYAN|nr:di-heme oxidoredictase family protein [Lyngbya confervoides]MCM1981623.1 c-type cytochrome [Lyngbya confervoides BDU141951]